MNIRLNIELFPWQKKVFDNLKEYPHATHVVKSKRQVGKSIMAETIILKTALEKPNSTSFFISPTWRQAGKVYSEISTQLLNAPFVTQMNGKDMVIRFTNGSSIQCFSGEQRIEALQGYTCTGILIFDECAFMDEQVYMTCLPFCNVSNAPVLCISTPRYKQGWFYDLYTDGLNKNPNVKLVDFNDFDTSCMLSQERLEYYKRRMPLDQYRQMYEGLFTESSGGVFSNFSKVFFHKNQINLVIQQKSEIYFGIDWGAGVGGDETAICIMNDQRIVLDIVHFNDKDETQTIETIKQLAETYKPRRIVAEKNSIGAVFLGLLRKKITNIPITAFNTTNENKHQLVSKLQVLIQNEEIKIPYSPELDVQFSGYEMKLSPTNKPTYNARSGLHDDMIMSILLAVSCVGGNKKTSFVLNNNSYSNESDW